MIVAISGGFDPIHIGHVNLIEGAAKYGDIIVILNSDAWLKRKKRLVFMPYENRARILAAMKNVLDVIPAEDDDETVCKTLAKLKPDFFANGGDRGQFNTPELALCADLKIRPLFGIGGEKLDSSSEIVKRAANAL